ncbi:MAG: hypothetical protein ABGX05_09935 [Pirellulaceae bacterium]
MRKKGFILLLLLSLFTLGCGNQARSPELEKAWTTTIELFDSFPEAAQTGFLSTFRPSAESAARKNLSGSELSERLEFIAELDAELRKRQK